MGGTRGLRSDTARTRFEEIASRPDAEIDLEVAALWIAAEERGATDVDASLAELDELARRAARCLESASGERSRVEALNHFLFAEARFEGNRDAYYDPRNSYLDQVLARRTGIPITLALVYLAIAKRLDLPLSGVGFPGHFLLRWDGVQEWLIDPFDGEVISRSECQRRLEAGTSGRVVLEPEVHLRAASPREILVRVLGNLKHVFAQCGDFERALACSERVLLLMPDAASELRDRALIYEQLDCPGAALSDLERFLELSPMDPKAPELLSKCRELRAQLGPLH